MSALRDGADLGHLISLPASRSLRCCENGHSGRRWFMTELARAGVHPRIIQQRAGHSSLATTQRYIEVTLDLARERVRAIRL